MCDFTDNWSLWYQGTCKKELHNCSVTEGSVAFKPTLTAPGVVTAGVGESQLRSREVWFVPCPKRITSAKASKGNIWQWFGKESENMQLFSVSDQHLGKRKTNGTGNHRRAVPTGGWGGGACTCSVLG